MKITKIAVQPSIIGERVVAEKQDGGGWLVMWPDGNVDWVASKRAVLAACKARLGTADILVTELDWRL